MDEALHWTFDDNHRNQMPFFQDQLVKDGGCLSVIPGSHCSPLHEVLWSLHGDIPERGAHLVAQPGVNPFGISAGHIPSFSVETQPGDVVFFSHQLWHASFGGRSGRRMFALGYKAKPTNDIERRYARRFLLTQK
ncbi:MAG: phytanoyl-CoA dioxygenase family protein [Candidatus Poribacteria bacterium]|nr:phytanoyl-CoA dioxygenase family protein [Candidatus Poribacteria bacterium]